ncbi:hypothetical protein LJK87_20760 [Paenibacillus sp. P25]|nr:hypothetical protein LJK87_20760 [Paenibacillus sp. P25]
MQKIGELMGADMYLYMDIGAPELLIVRTHAGHTFADNEKLTVTLDMNKALFFDKDTMDNLAY